MLLEIPWLDFAKQFCDSSDETKISKYPVIEDEIQQELVPVFDDRHFLRNKQSSYCKYGITLTSTTNLLFNQHDARKCYTSDFH
jgi:hypothetical protein